MLRVIEFSTHPHIPNMHVSTIIIKGNNLNPLLKNAIERFNEGRICSPQKKDYKKAAVSSVSPSSGLMTKG